MPCYLFTYHGYGTWMPDRNRGYVRRHRGVLSRDPEMADQYRRNAKHVVVTFESQHQLSAIDVLQRGVAHIDCRLHFVATDSTHVHLLVSWNGARTWEQNRSSLKRALTIMLKEKHGDRPWLSGGGSRKHVRDREHFDYLVSEYLPSHRGWKWCERRGLFLGVGGRGKGDASGERSSPAS